LKQVLEQGLHGIPRVSRYQRLKTCIRKLHFPGQTGWPGTH
jgi:hypothetical protein